MRCVSQVKLTLNPIYADLYPINPTIHTRQSLFHRRNSNFYVLNVVHQPVELRIHAAQKLERQIIRPIGQVDLQDTLPNALASGKLVVKHFTAYGKRRSPLLRCDRMALHM